MATIAQNPTVQPSPIDQAQQQARRFGFGFLVQAGYEMLGLTSALSVLRKANQLCGNDSYHWQLISPDGSAVSASDGLEVRIHQSAGSVDFDQLDSLIACGGENNLNVVPESALTRCLQQAEQAQLSLGAFGNGSLVLAHAGVLNGYSCAAHWDVIPTLRDRFPNIQVQPCVFEIDRNRFSCSGGNSAIDLMLALVTQQLGEELGTAISNSLAYDRARNLSELQQVPPCDLLGDNQPKLSEAIALMEANLEEPMTQTELASHVNISARQLERIFQKHLGRSPARYYLELRMSRARKMLIRTNQSIIDVAIANGFLSGTHFSRRYRGFFGISPREARKRSQQEEPFPAGFAMPRFAATG